ncbi:agmatine deiminase family protein [Streptomyces sp. NBC_00237]|uniref:hypothetical protein n=1 Tax=Streptomyces sp. NBC_00237 TaxID=2975687 RepID=UPI00225832DC|nr:hypothetical protein [Streptomyces sp. NBC_00237]MCX5206457.1 agmatine deiminase family protein [Streptomyces sp. NBC_00237]
MHGPRAGTGFGSGHVDATSCFLASYATYYLCNGAVISTHFGDTTADRAAVGGGIHCVTRQQPAV